MAKKVHAHNGLLSKPYNLYMPPPIEALVART